MNSKKVLVISDYENRPYWNAAAERIKEKIGTVRVVGDQGWSRQVLGQAFDMVLMDVSSLEDLLEIIPKIHERLPAGRIIVVTSAPTWKHTREFLRLGAVNLVRKTADVDEVIDEVLAV